MDRDRQQRRARLRDVALFAGCDDEQLDHIDQLITQIDVATGRSLTREGDTAREFVIVVSGSAGVFKGDEQVAEVGPGSFLGEIGLLYDVPRTATVRALTPMTIDVLNVREFRELLDTSDQLRRDIEAAALARFGEVGS